MPREPISVKNSKLTNSPNFSFRSNFFKCYFSLFRMIMIELYWLVLCMPQLELTTCAVEGIGPDPLICRFYLQICRFCRCKTLAKNWHSLFHSLVTLIFNSNKTAFVVSSLGISQTLGSTCWKTHAHTSASFLTTDMGFGRTRKVLALVANVPQRCRRSVPVPFTFDLWCLHSYK